MAKVRSENRALREVVSAVARRARPLRVARVVRINRMIRDLRERAEVGLHLGCGPTYIEGLVNADAHDDSVRDVTIDAMDLESYADGTVDHIETHHMFEHLSYEEGRRALGEWHRALKPGGSLVMTMPDLDRVIRLWRRSSQKARYERRASPVAAMIYGSQEHPGMLHRSGYNRREIRRVLEGAGYHVELVHSPYPLRATPSMVAIAYSTSDPAHSGSHDHSS